MGYWKAHSLGSMKANTEMVEMKRIMKAFR